MVPVELARLVLYDNAEQQFIYLREVGGERGFPIVIGEAEANEIRRVVTGQKTERPLTHQLAYQAIKQLGHDLLRVDIVDLRNNTFFAQLVLRDTAGSVAAVLDARPSDALALALRARCPVRVAEAVLASLRPDQGPDATPDADPKPE
jgi:bifunctional DNase/RNase